MYLFAIFKLKLNMNFIDGKLQRHLTFCAPIIFYKTSINLFKNNSNNKIIE